MADSSIRMVVTKTEIIVPTRLGWLALLAMIGIFGFFAQVLEMSLFTLGQLTNNNI
jgi:hypothetical protein